MDHFPSERWIQFAQGLGAPEQRDELERHLAEGCGLCSKTLRLWQTVMSLAKRERTYAPPGEDVELVKRAFSLQPKPVRIPLTETIARLIFDSMLQPAMAGVRSGTATNQRLTYEADDWLINVQMQGEARKSRAFLMGQILGGEQADVTRPGINVALLSGDAEIARTIADEQGEFEFQLRDEADLRLRIEASDREAVWVNLPNQEQD